jgi:hypothetical protein
MSSDDVVIYNHSMWEDLSDAFLLWTLEANHSSFRLKFNTFDSSSYLISINKIEYRENENSSYIQKSNLQDVQNIQVYTAAVEPAICSIQNGETGVDFYYKENLEKNLQVLVNKQKKDFDLLKEVFFKEDSTIETTYTPIDGKKTDDKQFIFSCWLWSSVYFKKI